MSGPMLILNPSNCGSSTRTGRVHTECTSESQTIEGIERIVGHEDDGLSVTRQGPLLDCKRPVPIETGRSTSLVLPSCWHAWPSSDEPISVVVSTTRSVLHFHRRNLDAEPAKLYPEVALDSRVIGMRDYATHRAAIPHGYYERQSVSLGSFGNRFLALSSGGSNLVATAIARGPESTERFFGKQCFYHHLKPRKAPSKLLVASQRSEHCRSNQGAGFSAIGMNAPEGIVHNLPLPFSTGR